MQLELSGQTISIEALNFIPTNGGGIATGKTISINLPSSPIRYLYSGWQSWSLTTWVDTSRPVLPMRPSSMNPLHTDPVYARETRPHGSWYGMVELAGGQKLFLGALGLESHVMLNEKDFTGWYEPGSAENLTNEWFVAVGDEDNIFSRYCEMLGENLGRPIHKDPHKVWCSWYSLYTEIHENQLQKILRDLGDLSFDVFQVDDGWQVGIGDWEPNAKFPSGMDDLASRIKKSGRLAGLWLAPLVVVPSSSLYKNHRDWLLKDEKGVLVSAGMNWGERLFTLDTTHPAVLDWLSGLMKKVLSWGYEYIKLDFLYAGALPGKRKVDIPRESAYRNGLKIIRETLGDAYFLTCGAPILPSIGLCDAMRIGPDVAGYWSAHRDDDLLMNFAIPGARNALRTSLHRLWLGPLVHTDPDVSYFRSRQNDLTPEQKSFLQDIAQICHFKATSDVPSWLTDSERFALAEYLINDLPVKKTGPQSFRVGERHVDFGPQIILPPVPGNSIKFLGSLLGTLANVPALMNLFDNLGKGALKKALKKNPV